MGLYLVNIHGDIEGDYDIIRKVKEGHWIPVYQGDEIIDYRCSECEFGSTHGRSTYRMNYCHNCGVKMKAGE